MRISIQRLGILLLTGLFAALSLLYAASFLAPFVFGMLLSIVLEPMIRKIERVKSFPRWLSVSIMLLLFLFLLIGGAALLINRVTTELFLFVWELPHYIDRFVKVILDLIPFAQMDNIYQHLISWYAAFYPAGEEELKKSMATWMNRGGEYVLFLIQRFLESFLSFLLKLPEMTATFFLSILASFFISIDLPRLTAWVKKKSPPQIYRRSVEISKEMKEGVIRYIKAQLILAIITAAGTSVGLLLLHLHYAFLLGLIAGLLDLIPLLGTGALFLPWIFYLFFSGNHVLVIGVSILYIVILLVRQVLEPRLVAQSMGVAPILTMLSLFLGLKWFGIIGLILAPFLLILLLSLKRAGLFHDLFLFLQEKK